MESRLASRLLDVETRCVCLTDVVVKALCLVRNAGVALIIVAEVNEAV
jgi:hypothetical protein